MNRPRAGFTLIEMLIVITIIAVLSGVGYNYYSDSLLEARENTVKYNLKVVRDAISRYFKDNMAYPTSLAALQGPYIQQPVNSLLVTPLAGVAEIEILGTTTADVNIYHYSYKDANGDGLDDVDSELNWIKDSLGTCKQFKDIRVKFQGTYLK